MIRNFLIVAGGYGSRMGSAIPKQFLEIGGKPILLRTLERIRCLSPEALIILVLPTGMQDKWEDICQSFQPGIPHLIAQGGKTRFHSVKNGLALIRENTEGLTAIHDGVRPFLTRELIERLTNAAKLHGNAIPAMTSHESLRKIGKSGNNIVDRDKYFMIQTPQVFHTSAIIEAYHRRFSSRFTDDASVMEHSGAKIVMVPGIRENIKITSPFDMIVAEAMVQSGKFQ